MRGATSQAVSSLNFVMNQMIVSGFSESGCLEDTRVSTHQMSMGCVEAGSALGEILPFHTRTTVRS